MTTDAPRLLIAATASGSGKTTIACGLMRSFQRRGLRVQAAKCGPDYVDPLFHTHVLGTPSRNLDAFLGDKPLVKSLVARGAENADLTIVEGVMGYYDGIAVSTAASSYDVARMTDTPVLLVVDGRRGLSVAAEVNGFLHFRTPSQIVGVLLNRVSAGYVPALSEAVTAETGLPVVGYLPQLDEAELQSRHLGLIPAAEVADLQAKVDTIAETLEQTVDLDELWQLARTAPPLSCERTSKAVPSLPCSPTIAVARDLAFTFYYADALCLLEELGARLVFFSPLSDEQLPEGVSGLYLGGGYPELHAQELSRNASMRESIAKAIAEGTPTIAECGGFMYLHKQLEDPDGVTWPMVGSIDGKTTRASRRRRFGYATLTSRHDSLLAKKGDELRAHEFHHWDSTNPGDAFVARRPSNERSWPAIISTPTLYAGFPHVYLPGNPNAAERFVRACAAYADAHRKG